MDEILDEMTLREYQTALASSSPTPGGGTAAAVALGHSAALTCMVCDLWCQCGQLLLAINIVMITV